MRCDLKDSTLQAPLGPLPHGWRYVLLGDITTKVGSGATPKGGAAAYLEQRHNYALIRSQNVFDRRFGVEGLAFISDQQAAKLGNAQVHPGDVLLNITGDGVTFGRACLAPDALLPACVNQHVAIIRADPKVCVPGYLLSYLTHPDTKTYIESFNAGGSRRAITKGHIESFVVPLPPLEHQKQIAHLLGTFDDKIELNRQMNQTLEEMARAHFKSWFVDFDPVRAKMEGREPAGMDAETAALFPDRLVDSELGPIPEGWEVRPLDKLIDVNPRRNLERGAVAPYVDMSSTPVKGHYPDSWYDREFTGSGTKFINGDTLMAKITPCLENGKTMYVDFLPDDTTVAWGSTEFLVLRPKPPYPPEFAYYMARSDELRAQAIGLMTGSSGRQRVPVTAFKALQVVVPSAEVAGAFGMLVRRWMASVRVNSTQSISLGAMLGQMLIESVVARQDVCI